MSRLPSFHHISVLTLYPLSKMFFTRYFKFICLQLLLFDVTNVQGSSAVRKPIQPEYISLPPLREQAGLKDAWTAQRVANIPNILQKYGVDAWLVSSCIIFGTVQWYSLSSIAR
jgi:hypothetical protein